MKQRFHLIGICGTAMASLAGLLHSVGHRVSGSDEQFYPPMDELLRKLGIPVFDGYRAENIQTPDRVVVGNAIARGNPELEFVLDHKIPYVSMPEVIRNTFLPGKQSVVVTGTHGKTTTTSMVAWILEKSGHSPSFLVGGIAENFSSSFQAGKGECFVIEGDEYDTAYFDKRPKFLHYLPDLLLINNIEYDHADIYPDLDSIKIQFRRLVRLLPSRGKIIAGGDSAAVRDVVQGSFCPVETFGFEAPCDWRALAVAWHEWGSRFRISYRDCPWGELSLPMLGEFNILNALGAVAVTSSIGIPPPAILDALREFKAPRRRLEEKFSRNGILLIEDFAHHPTAVRETLRALRARYPGRRIWAVFEPRSWSCRRKVHQDAFPGAFLPADITILADVYKKDRLPPAERLDPEKVVADLRSVGRTAYFLPDVEKIVAHLGTAIRPQDVICTMSNGDFDNIQEKLKNLLLVLYNEVG
jgi:UDP-N-acetylmuramate: L-alanyl-gamma-D-glutamyl-meso-diaminopimelate ligase